MYNSKLTTLCFVRQLNIFWNPRSRTQKKWNFQPNITNFFGIHRKVGTGTRIGQPHFTTHPHLLKPHELTIGVPKEEYIARRNEFINRLPRGSIAIFPAAKHCRVTNDIYYLYRPNSDFYYLSGFAEPESALILEQRQGKAHFTLFVRSRDPTKELWDGPRTGVERAAEIFGADEVYESEAFCDVVEKRIKHASHIFYNDIPTDIIVPEFLKHDKSHVLSPQPIIEMQRLIKTPVEIELMRTGANLSALSFIETMKYTHPGISEHELFAFIEFQCRKRGAQRLAYVPVIASGHNSLILHYINNDSILQDNELVLVDAGAEYQCYATDITRTWPINGKFTKAQLDVYNAVLDIQQKCISAVKEGQTIQTLYQLAVQLTMDKLISLGFSPHVTIKWKRYFPHNIGHYLGMDVHDVSTVPNSVPLQRGMVVTVEPGLYFPVDDPDVPPPYRGIGVRIEDDVLVTSTGREVLTRDAPKHPDLIEQLMQQTSSSK